MEQPPDMTKVGPVAWAELHAWASNFAAKVGDSCGCGAFAQDAAKALHDVVNLGLGKPALFPENLKAMAQVFQEAAGRVSQASTVKEPWQMTRAEFDKVYETQSKRSFSASLWAKLTLEERRTLIEEGRTYRRHTIEEAVRAGKPVPPEVLAEYPDLRPRLFATQANIYPWPEGMVDDDEEEEEGDMKQGRYPRTKLFDSEAEAREWAEGFRERLLPHLSVPHWEVHKWPQEWEPVEGATTWEVVYWYPHKEGVRLSQSFIDTILHTVVGTATATAVSKALTSDIKEGEKPKDAPAVLSPAHVEGDQANVDLGTLLEEIDAILKKPETMGIVDADTLVVVRE